MVDTFGETREHETKTQKGVAVSFSEGERRGGKWDAAISDISVVCFCLFYCICMCTQIQHYSCLFGTMSKTPHLFKLYISGCKITSFVLLWLCALQN